MADVSPGFRLPCWSPSECAPAWRLHTNLYKFEKSFLCISCLRNIDMTRILVRGFAYLPSFVSQILDFIYWRVLIFISICFKWRDTENQQLQAWILKMFQPYRIVKSENYVVNYILLFLVYLMPFPVRNVVDFNAILVNLHWIQDSRVFPACWILICHLNFRRASRIDTRGAGKKI